MKAALRLVSLVLLAMLLPVYGGLFAQTFPQGGGGIDDPLTEDLDTALFQIVRPLLGLQETTFPAIPTLLTTSAENSLVHYLVKAGPINVCSDGNSLYQQSTCNSDDDCPTGTCERAGDASTPSQVEVPVAFNMVLHGGNAAQDVGWFASDNIFQTMCYNIGPDCKNGRPTNSTQHALKQVWEIDYRPGQAANDDNRLTELYWSYYMASSTGAHLRTPFQSANMKPFDNRFSSIFVKNNYNLALWEVPKSTGSPAAQPIGGFWMGGSLSPKPFIGVTPSSSGLNGASALQVATGTGWGTDDPGMDIGSSTDPSVSVGIDVRFNHTQEINSQVTVSRNTSNTGPPSFGACNGSGAGALGLRCIDNRDCNAGDPWHTTTDQGICVKGNGANSSGTDDGICLIDATCAGGSGQTGGDCDGAGPDTYLDNIHSLCDVLDTEENRSDCDSNGLTTNSMCVDIQRFFINEAGAIVIQENNMHYDNWSENSTVGDMIFGYCSSGGGGSVEDEGRTCTENFQCSGTCVKDTRTSSRVASIVVVKNTLDLNSQMTERSLITNHTSGAFSNGDQNIGEATFIHNFLKVEGTTPTEIQVMEGIIFKAPVISVQAHQLGGAGDGLFKAEDQWANAVPGIADNNDWVPPILWAEAFSALNMTNEHPILRFDSGNFNNGAWRVDDMRLHVDDTNNVWRQKFDSHATSETDGNAILATPNNALATIMLVCESNGSTLNSGDDCCATMGAMTCVHADATSSTFLTETGGCATTETAGVDFWARCQ